MIRTLLMGLGAYTLYRMFVPRELERPRVLRDVAPKRATSRRRPAARSAG